MTESAFLVDPPLEETDDFANEDWVYAVKELDAFCADAEGIEVSATSFSIEPMCKEAFYQRFDRVREICVESFDVALLAQADYLVASYRQIVDSLRMKSNFEGIILPNSLYRFIKDPRGSLAGALFSPLMDMLKKKLTIDDIRKFLDQELPRTLDSLMRGVYEIWLVMALMDELDITEVYEVNFGKGLIPEAHSKGVIELGRQQPFPQRRIPEVVVVTKAGEYVAWKYDFAPELFSYNRPILRRRDFTCAGDSTGIVGHRSLLLYRCAGLHAIPTIADRQNDAITSPDVIVEYLKAEEFATLHGRTGIDERVDIMQPRNNPVVLLDRSCEPADLRHDEPPFTTLLVEMDKQRLAPIIELLKV